MEWRSPKKWMVERRAKTQKMMKSGSPKRGYLKWEQKSKRGNGVARKLDG